MCYEDGELPPYPPIRGGADAFGELTLLASDGVESNAFFAHPGLPSTRGVIILPDFRGVTEFYRDLAVRFAEAGVHAITIDYYTREIGRHDRPVDDREFYSAMLEKTDKRAVDLDVASAVAWLRDLPGTRIDSIFTVGFCCGGSYSWQQASVPDHLNGYVSFYGVPRLLEDERIATMSGPILMLIAGQDFTPVEAVEELADQVRASGEIVETHTYSAAAHGFFSRSGEFAGECDDAWQRVLDFFDRHATAAAS
jgi:carboxymethylenebutenolidase